MFIARINTAHVRAKGKPETADFLLALQTEWADALHSYQTHGIAVKAGRNSAMVELHQMIRSRERLHDPAERAAMTALIRAKLNVVESSTDAAADKQSALPFLDAA